MYTDSVLHRVGGDIFRNSAADSESVEWCLRGRCDTRLLDGEGCACRFRVRCIMLGGRGCLVGVESAEGVYVAVVGQGVGVKQRRILPLVLFERQIST